MLPLSLAVCLSARGGGEGRGGEGRGGVKYCNSDVNFIIVPHWTK